MTAPFVVASLVSTGCRLRPPRFVMPATPRGCAEDNATRYQRQAISRAASTREVLVSGNPRDYRHRGRLSVNREDAMADDSLAKLFWSRVERSGSGPAHQFKQGGTWQT